MRISKCMKINKHLAYILGVYLGDGCAYKHNRNHKICLAVKDKEFIEKFQNEMSKIIKGKKWKIYIDRTLKNKNPKFSLIYRIVIGNKQLFYWLKLVTQNKSIIPKEIIYSKREYVGQFLQGIVDSEGSIVQQNKNSKGKDKNWFTIRISGTEKWFLKLNIILDILGIKHGGMKKFFRKERGYYEYMFNINARSYKQSGLTFNIYRKAKLLSKVT